MTDGPAARIREIVEVPFGRPRTRATATAHPDTRACASTSSRFWHDPGVTPDDVLSFWFGQPSERWFRKDTLYKAAAYDVLTRLGPERDRLAAPPRQ